MKTAREQFLQSVQKFKNGELGKEDIVKISNELGQKKIHRLKNETKIQERVQELFSIFIQDLENKNISNETTISAIVEGLVAATTHEVESNLLQDIAQKETLENQIVKKRHEIRQIIANTYNTIDGFLENYENAAKDTLTNAISDTKLKGIELLGILKETASEAILTALEKGDDVENTITQITNNITYQAINEGVITKSRILSISKTIIDGSIEIADEDIAFAKEILSGSVRGTREGIIRAVEKFHEEVAYMPKEVEERTKNALKKTEIGLLDMEDSYIALLRQCASSSKGISRKIISDYAKDLDSTASRLQRVSHEARKTITQKLNELKDSAKIKDIASTLKEDAIKLEKEITEKVGKKIDEITKEGSVIESDIAKKATREAKRLSGEAKKLGFRTWEVAKKGIDSALKNAKETLNKKSDK